ncbi:MAG: hypothetical protein QOI47_1807 [Actinomycetota bacterium]|nr:hypothetical protein [Actinomycetota bacterium]
METVVAALAEQQDELSDLVAGLDEAGWQRSSQCEGWSISDVVLHVAQTNEMALASATDRLAEWTNEVASDLPPSGSIDERADQLVAHQRGAPGADVLARYRASGIALREALLARRPDDRVQWVAGELAARTLATTRLAETWIHTGDVADGLGVTLEPTDRLWHVARLAWRTLPYAFARDGRELSGPVAFELRSPGGNAWDFGTDTEPLTTIRGTALDLVRVASRRVAAKETELTGDGPDAEAVLELVRTWA